MNNDPLQEIEQKRLAVSADELAELLGISSRHVWGLNSSGKLPKPVRFGRNVRWSVAELRAWLDAGAPERSRWEILRDADRKLAAR